MRNYKQDMLEVKGTSHITVFPIEGFDDLSDLENFVKYMKRNGIGTVLHYESSNFHQGVVVQAFDKESCSVKKYIGE